MSDPHTPSPHVVILGAGLCGLYAARTLRAKGFAVTLVEKETWPGGLAMGQCHNGNWYDLGVHMLHEHDKGVFEDMKLIMGDERIAVQLDAKIKWMGHYYRYPLQFGDMVRHMNPFRLVHYGTALVLSQIYHKWFPKEPRDAEEALIQLYGKPLYEFFFKEFTHRYWGIPPSGLSAGFIKSKMPRLSAVDLIKKALGKVGIKEKEGATVESALLDETLHYSRTGAEALPRRLAAFVESQGAKILLGHAISAIEREGDRVIAVRARDVSGRETRVQCDWCINTIPVPPMMAALEPPPPPETAEAAKKLRYKAIAVYGVLVGKDCCIDSKYVYFRRRIFHRVGEPKNGGLVVRPDGHTVLIVEMTCDVGDGKWKGDPETWQQIVSDLEAEGVCKPQEIVEHHVLTCPTGYPIFEFGFEENHDKVKSFLAGLQNLSTTGRQGGFCYPNMHGAMRMGAKAAEEAIGKMGL